MNYVRNNVKGSTKEKVGGEQITIDFGNRKICNQNFSKLVALPKGALANCGKNARYVNVKLVQMGTEQFLKLTPVQEGE
ncbi:hypothetical protein [Candidatus Nitrososphaera evergladensis]|uniref:hypothetical protein n=1 Tax=Candidatus Nitrososphaera evergladensis TaxID=1459637 RepID=UPI001D049EC0|nr:hypothetical protein [Candidatus Nitrososphaera evergladensis]